MAAIRGLPGAARPFSKTAQSTSQAKLDEVMSKSSSMTESEPADLGTALKNKAKSKRGLNPQQKAAYDKQVLAAVQGMKPLGLSASDKLAVAAVVPGALGALQPSGVDLPKPATRDTQMATMELQSAMQNQQRAMQSLSNILKAQHDTASAIIRNLR